MRLSKQSSDFPNLNFWEMKPRNFLKPLEAVAASPKGMTLHCLSPGVGMDTSGMLTATREAGKGHNGHEAL